MLCMEHFLLHEIILVRVFLFQANDKVENKNSKLNLHVENIHRYEYQNIKYKQYKNQRSRDIHDIHVKKFDRWGNMS